MSINTVRTGVARSSVQSQQLDSQNNGKRIAIVAGTTTAGAVTGMTVPYFITERTTKSAEKAAKIAQKTAKASGSKQFAQVANDLLKNGSDNIKELLNNIEDFSVRIASKGGQKFVDISPKEDLIKAKFRTGIEEVRNKTGKSFTLYDKFRKDILAKHISEDVRYKFELSPYNYVTGYGLDDDVKKLMHEIAGSYQITDAANGATVMNIIKPGCLDALEAKILKKKKLSSVDAGIALTEKIKLDQLKEGEVAFIENELSNGSKEFTVKGLKGVKSAVKSSYAVKCVAGAVLAGLSALALGTFLTSKKPFKGE